MTLCFIILLIIYLIAFSEFIAHIAKSRIKSTAKGISVNIPINTERLYKLLRDNNFTYPEMITLLLTKDNNILITGKYTTHKISINNNKIYVVVPSTKNIIRNSIYNYEAFIISEYLKQFFNNDTTFNIESELLEFRVIRNHHIIVSILLVIMIILSVIRLYI